jgi:hypothetical protein
MITIPTTTDLTVSRPYADTPTRRFVTLPMGRRRTQHFQRTKGGCGPIFYTQFFKDFEDMLFDCRFGITKNDCNL